MLKRSLMFILITSLMVIFPFGPSAAPDTLKIALVIEQTGAGASLADYWIKGANLAVEEINKAGGALGRKIEIELFDSQSKPPVSISAMKKALAWEPFSISGTIYSSSTLANMVLAQEAKTLQFTGSENWRISTMGNKYIWRTSTQQGFEIPKLLNWVMGEKKVKAVAMLYVNNDYGMGGLETTKKVLKEKWNTGLVYSGATEQKQADYTAELNHIKNAKADAVFAYLLEEEASMFYRQVKKMGLNVLLFGPNSGISEVTLRLGKEAVEGVYGMSGFEYTAPEPNSQRLGKYYKEKYGSWPDNEFMKGYNSIYLPFTGIQLANSLDKEKVAEKLRNVFITPKIQPNIVGGNLFYDEVGDLHAWDYLTRIVWDGKEAVPKVEAALPPLKGPDSNKAVIYYK